MIDIIEYKNDGVMCYSVILWNRESREGIEVRLSPFKIGESPDLSQEQLKILWAKNG